MDRFYAQRQPAARKPLGDATSRANMAPLPAQKWNSKFKPPPPRSSSPMPVPVPLPHNESIVPNGSLRVRNPDASRSPGHRRVAEIVEEEGILCGKRDSACSTSSNTSGLERKRKTHIGPWQLGKTIGRGGCSQVRAVRHSVTGQYGAAKIIQKSTAETVRAISLANLCQSSDMNDMSPEGRQIPVGLEREIVIMKLLEHRNIVRLFDVWENRNEIYLIMEYVQGGELFNYISERRGLDEDEAVYLFRQIIAALIYCHRINIHHRDLKPENILLDKVTHELKLVDFGMAALQPAGKYLTTPCGSPHYAAPEVIRSKNYDGGKADVWSCGVILFVMLAGFPPFTYSGDDRDLKELFRQIVNAEYQLPDSFTPEAKDLLRRILVPDPRKRISIEKVWSHPLLHKFDDQLGYSREQHSMDTWIGPAPTLDDWEYLTKDEIDTEILRNMRVLWHSEKREELVNRLLSRELNHEKFFYSALLKHRRQHLEDYAGSIGYSSSDYHHERTPDLEVPPMPQRSQSAYSIMNNEHLYSKHSFYEPPTSERSYDPFRSSRNPIVDGKTGVNVTVHRSNLSAHGRQRPGNGSSSLRVETLRRTSRQQGSVRSFGASSNMNMSKRSSVARKSVASSGRSVSRISVSSSIYPSSPPIYVKPRNTYKRGVSFAHIRRTSGADAWGSDTTQDHEEPTTLLHPKGAVRPGLRSQRITPRPTDEVTSRKQPATLGQGKVKLRKPHPTASQYISQDVRKVSSEFDQLCDEAFFRSSVDSSMMDSMTDKPSPYQTPPSSTSREGSAYYGKNRHPAPMHREVFQNRPLPPLPAAETPNTFIARELAETRERLMKRYQLEGDTTANFHKVIRHIEEMLEVPANANKRTVSAPQPHPNNDDHPGYLPAISEEDHEKDYRGHRSVTDPVHNRPHQAARKVTDPSRTIRVVDPSSPTPIAPLNIRKVSGASSRSTDSKPYNMPHGLTQAQSRAQAQDPPTVTISNHDSDDPSPSINPVPEKGLKKKRSWLLRLTQKDEKVDKEEVRQKIPEAWQGLDDRIKNTGPTATSNAKAPPSKLSMRPMDVTSHASSEFPMRQAPPPPRKGFLKFFSKFTKHDPKVMDFDSANDMSTTSFGSNEFSQGGEETKGNVDYQRNWLARFLHIKPITKIMCFQIGRGRARAELVRLLKDWRRFGVRDVLFNRATNSISARVGKSNHLTIRPVSFVIELFVVLEHGRRAQLCLARFTQTKGAASSFRKIVDVVEDVCAGRGLLVEDEEKKKAMGEVLG